MSRPARTILIALLFVVGALPIVFLGYLSTSGVAAVVAIGVSLVSFVASYAVTKGEPNVWVLRIAAVPLAIVLIMVGMALVGGAGT
jgi:hypothetical protein